MVRCSLPCATSKRYKDCLKSTRCGTKPGKAIFVNCFTFSYCAWLWNWLIELWNSRSCLLKVRDSQYHVTVSTIWQSVPCDSQHHVTVSTMWQSVPFECLVFPKNSNYHIIPELLLDLLKVAQYTAMSTIFSQIGLAVGDIESIKKEAALQKHSVQVGRGRQKVILVTVSGWLCCAVCFFSLYVGFCCCWLCCSVLCCAVLYCTVLCCVVLCCAVLCCSVLCCVVLCNAVLCCAVLCCAALCCAVLCCTMLCCAVVCCVALS